MIIGGTGTPSLDEKAIEAAWFRGFQHARATNIVNTWNWQGIWATAMQQHKDSGRQPTMVKIASFSQVVGPRYSSETEEEYRNRIAALDRAANEKASDHGGCAIVTDEAVFFYLSS